MTIPLQGEVDKDGPPTRAARKGMRNSERPGLRGDRWTRPTPSMRQGRPTLVPRTCPHAPGGASCSSTWPDTERAVRPCSSTASRSSFPEYSAPASMQPMIAVAGPGDGLKNINRNNNHYHLIIINSARDSGLLCAPRTSLAGLVLPAAFLAHGLLLVEWKRRTPSNRTAQCSARGSSPPSPSTA